MCFRLKYGLNWELIEVNLVVEDNVVDCKVEESEYENERGNYGVGY